jgi:DNA-binding response OmpR family regulator
MHEYGTALVPHPRPVVIAEHQHEIVEMIFALQPFGAAPRRQRYQPVVVAVGGIVAPAITVADRANRKLGAGPGDAVGSIQHLADRKTAERRAAVGFAFQGAYAGPAKRRGPDAMPKRDQCFARVPRCAPHQDRPGSLNPHDNEPSLPPGKLRDRLVQALRPAYNSHNAETSQGPPMSNARKILIIDDDDELRESLSEQLSLHEEFDTLLAATASEGLKQARGGHVDLVLLDVGLPDLDGREACKLLRRGGFKGPVVMLTAQVSDADTILSLESGANDYVTKPFRLGVLLARIRAQLRQHEQSEDAVFTIGPYTFRPASKLLVDGAGAKIRLTEKETSILKYLYRAGERVVTRDVLLHEVWGYNAGVTTHTLETHIYRLRQKIEKDPSQAELLITETGGYKLVP